MEDERGAGSASSPSFLFLFPVIFKIYLLLCGIYMYHTHIYREVKSESPRKSFNHSFPRRDTRNTSFENFNPVLTYRSGSNSPKNPKSST